MRVLISAVLLGLLVAGRGYAADPLPRPLLDASTYPFSFTGGLSGPEAAHLRQAFAEAEFKFGGNHMMRGLGSTGAWTLGGLLHDLAALNGATAYGVCVFAVGGSTPDWAQAPDLLRPLLPAARPREAVLIDLQALRPIAQAYVDQASAESRNALHDLIFGYDALVVLPNSRAASWRLTGFSNP